MMIALEYSEAKLAEIDTEELYDALMDAWNDNGNDISDIKELKNCWCKYEDSIINNICSIWIDGDIVDTNLNAILTPEFWDKFYKYVEENE